MARTSEDAKLDTPTARAKRAGKPVFWSSVSFGETALGYRRRKEGLPGVWLVRRYVGSNGKGGGRYRIEKLGVADDLSLEANDGTVLSYKQAQAKVQGTSRALRPMTVREVMANYIESRKALGKSIRDTEQRANALILPALGDKEVSKLTTEDVERWLGDYAATPALIRPKKNGERKKRPALGADREAIRRRRASGNRLLTILRAALNLAHRRGHIQSDLAWKRVKPFHGVDVARVAYLSVEEVQRLINACSPEFRPLVRGALETGARYGELIALQVADFDARSDTVHIRHSKSGRDRHINLTEDGVAFFRRLVAGRLGDDLIFRRDGGSAWGKAHQNRFMDDAVTAAKIRPRITFHGLRHTWASLAVMAGMPIPVVARNLGHATSAMVEKHYGHLAPSYIAEAVRRHAPRYGLEEDANVVPIRRKGDARAKHG
jgi:integrase